MGEFSTGPEQYLNWQNMVVYNARAHLMKQIPAMRLAVQVTMECSTLLLLFNNKLRDYQQVLTLYLFQSTAVGANGVCGSPAANLAVGDFKIGQDQYLKWQNMVAYHVMAHLMKLMHAMKLAVQVRTEFSMFLLQISPLTVTLFT